MLGKGLESLIPQKGGQSSGDGSQNGGANSPAFGGPSTPAAADGDFRSGNNLSVPAWKPQQPAQSQNPQPQPAAPKDLPPLDLPVLSEELELPVVEEELELPSGNTEEMQITPPNLPSERGGTIPQSPTQKSEPPVNRLSQSSIPVAARNAIVGSSAAAASFLGQKNVVKVQTGPAIAGSVFHIETDKISPNPNQPRRHFDETALKDLAYSIREFGVLQPLVVTKKGRETPNGIEVEYELIAGERRLLAAKLLGLKTVPAIIRNVSLEREKLELAVIENIQRENLNAIETARAFERLRDEFKMTQREIAAKLGKSREVVANTVRLLDLPGYAQEALEKGQLSESNARFLLSVDDQEARKKLFDDIIQHGLTTRDVKDRVATFGRKRGRPRKDANIVSPELRAIQDELSSELGAPVEIEKKTEGGKITITFYSEEELENILRKIGKDGGS
jgi:ParB family chromosome partitioning protein